MSTVKLEWASAKVEDATLTVALDGEVPKGWKQSFETTARLLRAGEWGEVKLKKDTVQVSDVTTGSEDKLRHHLEGIVAQANASVEATEREEAQADDDAHQEHGREASGPDAEMTERFRSSAED